MRNVSLCDFIADQLSVLGTVDDEGFSRIRALEQQLKLYDDANGRLEARIKELESERCGEGAR